MPAGTLYTASFRRPSEKTPKSPWANGARGHLLLGVVAGKTPGKWCPRAHFLVKSARGARGHPGASPGTICSASDAESARRPRTPKMQDTTTEYLEMGKYHPVAG